MRFFLSVFLLIGLLSCNNQDNHVTRGYDLMEIPEGFPEINFPDGNEFTKERWELGKKLFFDPIMSIDSTVSCASCHNPNLAFADNKALSFGVENRIGNRNAPTLTNVAYNPYFTSEGGVKTLETQILVPIQEHNEFDFNIVDLSLKLEKKQEYVEMANLAYDQAPNPYVITRSLAAFERSLISGNSPFDQYYYQNLENVLTENQLKGMRLFFSEKANCTQCHSGFNFTNYSFENNGLYVNYEDSGRYRLTSNDTDIAQFKVPTLRNVSVTSPYMHDGSLNTLIEVVEHYNKGGENSIHQSNLIKPLNLTEAEKVQLVAFLESLTDETFIFNQTFSTN